MKPSASVHPCATREEAERVLAPYIRNRGTFLIRKSTSTVGSFGISVVTGAAIVHYKIDLFPSRKYGIQDGLHFRTLQDLVDHYLEDRDGLCCRLSRNVLDRASGGETGDYADLPPVPRRDSVTSASSSRRSSMTTTTTATASRRIIPVSQISRGATIGEGEFGEVCQGVWSHDGRRENVAIKYLKSSDPESRKEFQTEANRIMGFSHECIVGVKGMIVEGEVGLVLELLPLGALNKYLKQRVNMLPARILMEYISQIAEGMTYLESKKVLHRDLAARNILVRTPDSVQISDFGLARDTQSKDYYTAETAGKWPVKWYALECIYYRKFTHKSDVWSFGVCSWEIFSYGAKPYGKWKGQQVVNFLEQGQRLPIPPNCRQEVYGLLMRCWSQDPNDRPTFRMIVEELQRLIQGPDDEFSGFDEPDNVSMQYAIDNQKIYDTRPDPQEMRICQEESRNHVMSSLKSTSMLHTPHFIEYRMLAFSQQKFDGSFGPVSCGTLNGRVDVAIKSIERVDTFNASVFQKQIQALRKIKNPNIVECYGYSVHPNKSVLVLQAYQRLGPLNLYVRKTRVDPKQVVRFAFQIAAAMKYLEASHIVHRDLAARNVLVSDQVTCKVSDAGMSEALGVGPDYYRSVQGSTPDSSKTPMKWYSPEAIATNIFTTKSDVWSWGVTFWEIMSNGMTPYGDNTTGSEVLLMLHRNALLDIPAAYTRGPHVECAALVKKTWNKDPNCRPSFREIHAALGRIVPAAAGF